MRRVLAKARLADVIHEGVAGQHVLPAGGLGAHAEVVLLAVAPSERGLVEGTDRIETVAADVHAEADGGGHLDLPAAVGGVTGGVDRVQRHAGRQFSPGERRPTADRGVVREGRHAADPCAGVGMADQPLEPVGGHFRIAVEEHHVTAAGLQHPAVHARHEPAIGLVPQERDLSPCGEGIEPVANLRVGRAVVDDEHLDRHPATVLEHRLEAPLGLLESAVDRNHHGHRDLLGQGPIGRSRREVGIDRHAAGRGRDHDGALGQATAADAIPQPAGRAAHQRQPHGDLAQPSAQPHVPCALALRSTRVDGDRGEYTPGDSPA